MRRLNARIASDAIALRAAAASVVTGECKPFDDLIGRLMGEQAGGNP